VTPPDAYRPAPGWYRHGGVERWHTGHRWTDLTRPLPELRKSRKPLVLNGIRRLVIPTAVGCPILAVPLVPSTGSTVFRVLLVAVLLVLLGRSMPRRARDVQAQGRGCSGVRPFRVPAVGPGQVDRGEPFPGKRCMITTNGLAEEGRWGWGR
jgi:hypothetical protein